EKVAPCEGDGDGLGLDRRRLSIAFVLQSLEDRRGEAEGGKACQLLALSRGRACSSAPTRLSTPSATRSPLLEDTPRVLGCRINISGRSTGGRSGQACPLHSSFTRLERRNSLMERSRLVSRRGAQVKLYVDADFVSCNAIAARPISKIADWCSN